VQNICAILKNIAFFYFLSLLVLFQAKGSFRSSTPLCVQPLRARQENKRHTHAETSSRCTQGAADKELREKEQEKGGDIAFPPRSSPLYYLYWILDFAPQE
jgi:hypothetical protein